MKKHIRVIVIAGCVWAAFGWWGALYPALAMPPDTYRVINGGDTEETTPPSTYRVIDKRDAEEALPPWNFDASPYFDILRAEPGQVQFKSKLWMQWKQFYTWEIQKRLLQAIGKLC